jgi:phosphatidate cytidylyltransferase
VKRILSAIVFLPLFYFIVRRPPIYFTLLIGTAAVLALLELYRLAARTGLEANRPLGILLVLGVVYSFHDPRWPAVGILTAGVILAPVASLLSRRPFPRCLASDAVTLFGAAFLGLLLGAMVALRGLGDERGGDLVFLLFLVVWAGDTAAYYAGSAIGRRRLTPRVSPGKTVEGAVAGVLASVAAAQGARYWFVPDLGAADAVVIGILLAGGGIVGDLVESMWKRGAGAKDSAGWVPGHGGILDRCDSLLFGGPILYYYILQRIG